jgi:hypothetical protein
MTTDTKTEATIWHCADCNRQLDELDNYCGNCGKARPAPEPAMTDDERKAWELLSAAAKACGETAPPWNELSAHEKSGALAILARARALLATEPEPLTAAELTDVAATWQSRHPGAMDSDRTWAMINLACDVAEAQRRRTRPAQPKPAPAKAPWFLGYTHRNELSPASMEQLEQWYEDRHSQATLANTIGSKEYNIPLPLRLVLDEVAAKALGRDLAPEPATPAMAPPEPQPAPSPEAETTALDAWLDSHDVMQSTRSEVRHCYRSDLYRATQALRERAEKDLDRDVTQPLLERADRLERERDSLRAKLAEAEAERGRLRDYFVNERGRLRVIICDLVEAITGGRVASWGKDEVMSAKVTARELSAENARLRGEAGKAGLPSVKDKLMVLGNSEMDTWLPGTVESAIMFEANVVGFAGLVRIFLTDEGKTWRRVLASTKGEG